jgi:hypothetical protein
MLKPGTTLRKIVRKKERERKGLADDIIRSYKMWQWQYRHYFDILDMTNWSLRKKKKREEGSITNSSCTFPAQIPTSLLLLRKVFLTERWVFLVSVCILDDVLSQWGCQYLVSKWFPVRCMCCHNIYVLWRKCVGLCQEITMDWQCFWVPQS